MPDKLQHYVATDKEVYDLLASGKQKITEPVLRELARDRGIFYSPNEPREALVDHLSMLPHDYHDITGIIQRREHGARREKTTSLKLNIALTIDEIKEVVGAYKAEAGNTEKVTSHQRGSDGFVMNIEYDEFDYSRTRLIQRQRKDAGIEFVVKGSETTVRMPATEKGKMVVEALKNKIESKRKTEIAAEEIELTGLRTAEERTSFFTELISKMPGYRQVTVTSLKVASGFFGEDGEATQIDLEEDDEAEAVRVEMLTVVRQVAISGENLVASPVYQELRNRGFFITSVTWRSAQTAHPYNLVQFEIGFDNPHEGKGFRYSVRLAPRLLTGEHAKNLRPVPPEEKGQLFELIETTARSILSHLNSKVVDSEPEEGS